MSQVFISYATKSKNSKAFVQELKGYLVQAGFDVWVDDILQAGQNWQVEIDNAIKASFAVIIIMTPEANESRYVIYEWAFALGAGKEIIPVLLESSNNETDENRKPHPRLHPTHIHYLDCTSHFPAPYEKVVQTVIAKATRLEQKKQEVPLFIKLAVSALENYEPKERKTAVESLAQSNHPAAIEALADACNHHVRDVRFLAALNLAKVTDHKDDRPISALGEALSFYEANFEDPYEKIFPIFRSLVNIGSYEAITILLRYLKTPPPLRHNNRYILSSDARYLTNDESLPLLIEGLGEKTVFVRRFAVIAVGKLKAKSAVDGLRFVLNSSPDLQLAIEVIHSLERIESRDAVQDVMRFLETHLIENKTSQTTEQLELYILCTRYLKSSEDPSCIATLLNLAEYTSGKSFSISNLTLIPTLIEAFGSFKAPLSVDFIATYLLDERRITLRQGDEEKLMTLGEYATEALVSIGTEQALEALRNSKQQNH